MNAYNKMQLVKAIQYLRSRGKYILDEDCVFKPSCAAATDVAKTFEMFRKAVMAQEPINIRKLK